MAAISASSTTSTMARAALVPKGPIVISSSPVLGLPQIGMKGGRVRCSAAEGTASEHRKGAGALSLLAAAAAAATGVMSVSSPALALVDDRLSTEGTGLPFGLSNNLLGWILFGVFGLIWSFYFIYTSTLEEDEESGLSL